MSINDVESSQRRFLYHLLFSPAGIGSDDVIWEQLSDQFFKEAVGVVNELIIRSWFNDQRPDRAEIDTCFNIIILTAAAMGVEFSFDQELFTGLVEGAFGDMTIFHANEHRSQEIFAQAIMIPMLLLATFDSDSAIEADIIDKAMHCLHQGPSAATIRLPPEATCDLPPVSSVNS
jgi:hypothetical protein